MEIRVPSLTLLNPSFALSPPDFIANVSLLPSMLRARMAWLASSAEVGYTTQEGLRSADALDQYSSSSAE